MAPLWITRRGAESPGPEPTQPRGDNGEGYPCPHAGWDLEDLTPEEKAGAPECAQGPRGATCGDPATCYCTHCERYLCAWHGAHGPEAQP